MKNTTENFISYFKDLKNAKSEMLHILYASNIHFQDPIHAIQGIDKLVLYFETLNANVKTGGFGFYNVIETDNFIILEWNMNIETIKPSLHIQSKGVSILKIVNDKIIEHKDYFDAGQMFYENIPLLGAVIRFIKKKLSV